MFRNSHRSLISRLSLCLILATFATHSAEPYRLELHGGFSKADTDTHSYAESFLGNSQNTANVSSDRLELAGAYFFKPVETNNGPLKEAAFLERASALTFSVAEARADSESRGTTSLGGSLTQAASLADSESSDYRLRYRFVAPEKPWIGVISYDYGDNTTENLGVIPQTVDETRTAYSVGMGRYVGPRTSVIAEYGRSHLDTDLQPVIGGSPGLLPSLSVRREILTVGVHSLLKLGTHRHLGLTAALHETAATSANISDESVGSYEIGVAYYPRNDVSIAFSAAGEYGTDAWDGDRHGYKLEASWFVSESIAVGLGYETTDLRIGFTDTFGFSSAAENDSDGFRLNVSWRH